MKDEFHYQTGFANEFATEALEGALPVGQNAPQQVPYNLYTEQLSGSAFTAPRHRNRRSWLYRLRPSVCRGSFEPVTHQTFAIPPEPTVAIPPNPLRWDPLPLPELAIDWIDGMVTMATQGCPTLGTGAAIHHYACNHSMRDRYFSSSDGDLLIVPERGSLLLATEMGLLALAPGEIAVIPRGIVFRVQLAEKSARGYVCENYGAPFLLPELGLIGANGLANSRDFQTPVACFLNETIPSELYCKFQNNLWRTTLDHSPLDVVAWHGNYAPYKYDLAHFNTINTVSFDHPDPSIFTVLTSPSPTPGVANIDFVIFPERWMVAEHTFRPPYFHRNVMSEYMGLIKGQYDAKPSGFVPGGASLHNGLVPHGPDADAYAQALRSTLKPHYEKGILACMFESSRHWQPSHFALNSSLIQTDYSQCWQSLPLQFTGK